MITNNDPIRCENPACGKVIGPGQGMYLVERKAIYCRDCGRLIMRGPDTLGACGNECHSPESCRIPYACGFKWGQFLKRIDPALFAHLEERIGDLTKTLGG